MIHYLLFLLLIVTIGLTFYGCKVLHVPTYKGPITERWDGKKFSNPSGNEMGDFRALMQYQLKNKRSKWDVIKNHIKPFDYKAYNHSSIYYKQINHATVLVQHAGLNILTDPVYGKRASPFSWSGPKRNRPAAIPFEDLPKIDLIVISHDHYDHLDVPTLKKLNERDTPMIYVGLGMKAYLEKFKIKNVVEMDWGDKTEQNGMSIHFLPAKHWSNRFLSPRKTLWGSWMFTTSSKTIYFAGDTGYDDHFKQIKKDFPTIDLALIPIGAYEPRFFMQHVHMAPEDAYKAHQDLASKKSFAIHWGTFQLTHEGMFDPIDELQVILDQHNDEAFHYDRQHDQYYEIK